VDANFEGADMTNAVVDRVDFSNAKLNKVKFVNAVVTGKCVAPICLSEFKARTATIVLTEPQPPCYGYLKLIMPTHWNACVACWLLILLVLAVSTLGPSQFKHVKCLAM
jgi:hypothetical protein